MSHDRDELVLRHLDAGGIRAIAEAAGIRRSAVERSLASLVKAGRITITPAGRNGKRATYTVASPETVRPGGQDGPSWGGKTLPDGTTKSTTNETSLSLSESCEKLVSSSSCLSSEEASRGPGRTVSGGVTLLPDAGLVVLTLAEYEALRARTLEPEPPVAEPTPGEPPAKRSSVPLWRPQVVERKRVWLQCRELLTSQPRADGKSGEDDVFRYPFERVRRSIQSVTAYVLEGKPVKKNEAALFWKGLNDPTFTFEPDCDVSAAAFAEAVVRRGWLKKAERLSWARWFFSVEGLAEVDVRPPEEKPPAQRTTVIEDRDEDDESFEDGEERPRGGWPGPVERGGTVSLGSVVREVMQGRAK